ncbi:TPA: hypothetical protein L0X63_002192 [Enterococcus faecalis]|nr:conserved hypothetical protein [Enterococcus faecalis ATCC 4200]EEU83662.1 conserved hypothetical protein [Enterococcus faecalis D6]HBM8962179.1 hypothetical protein [Enterococcus faecalis]
MQMGMTPDDFWFCPLGLFLDLWECHKQFAGISKPKVEMFIDDVIPSGI